MHSVLKNTLETTLCEPIVSIRNSIIQTLSGKEYFLKTGTRGCTYQCEANGLAELAKAKTIRTTNVISCGEDYILTQYIRRGNPDKDFFSRFGKSFAQMHHQESQHFGFYENNFIGATDQLNLPDQKESSNWISFYFNKRLLFQYQLAEKNGFVSSGLKKGFINLENKIDIILKDNMEPPCLLHGDLWAGNFICDEANEVILIDPAVYYGNREADLAMTKLFGCFPPDFYQSYQEEYPLRPGWEYRESVYKLYHVLNHLNLFGTGYLHEAESILNNY